jgi:hypothetical protein
VSRLWSRYGARSLAIGLLVFSLVGGYWLAADLRAQRHDAALDATRQGDIDDLAQLKLDMNVQQLANAPQRAAQADAQAKADAAAQAAADQARAADDAARRPGRPRHRYPSRPRAPRTTATRRSPARCCRSGASASTRWPA